MSDMNGEPPSQRPTEAAPEVGEGQQPPEQDELGLALRMSQETEAARLERLRKENHFTATESTCVVTLTALFPVLRKMISRHLDTDAIINQLRENPDMDTGDKLRLWGRLKIISVSR